MEIIEEIERARKKDFEFKSGHILGSMCTSPHPIGKKIYSKFIETNLGDPELFKGTKELEEKAIEFVAEMLHAPKGYKACSPLEEQKAISQQSGFSGRQVKKMLLCCRAMPIFHLKRL